MLECNDDSVLEPQNKREQTVHIKDGCIVTKNKENCVLWFLTLSKSLEGIYWPTQNSVRCLSTTKY